MSISERPHNGKPNPHVWTSAENTLIYVDNIRDALIKYDPDNSTTCQNNAQSYKTRIQQTLAPLRTELAGLPADKRWLVTSEDAFSYLAHDNNLKELYLWSINTNQQGTPKQIHKAIDAIRAYYIPTVFSESTMSNKPTHQTARESGAHYGGALCADSLSATDGPVPTYLDLLCIIMQTIVNGINKSLESQP